ncbi:hypothetical protein GGS24DRAFT_372592 [Hypoxylon argillaceum]|nr:hypothetical protein GGS24DRAFT_372592 [Hypoxylon argillaceum]
MVAHIQRETWVEEHIPGTVRYAWILASIISLSRKMDIRRPGLIHGTPTDLSPARDSSLVQFFMRIGEDMEVSHWMTAAQTSRANSPSAKPSHVGAFPSVGKPSLAAGRFACPVFFSCILLHRSPPSPSLFSERSLARQSPPIHVYLEVRQTGSLSPCLLAIGASSPWEPGGRRGTRPSRAAPICNARRCSLKQHDKNPETHSPFSPPPPTHSTHSLPVYMPTCAVYSTYLPTTPRLTRHRRPPTWSRIRPGRVG